jgi:hypothetical protein
VAPILHPLAQFRVGCNRPDQPIVERSPGRSIFNGGQQIMLNVAARAGDWVEVRSADEIMSTLDEHGALDSLPFMPEMLQYCGKRFQVYKSAHKGCDTLHTSKSRSINDAVHLEGLRCDGSAHGGCQALCLLYWKTSWLKRIPGPEADETPARAAEVPQRSPTAGAGRFDARDLARATQAPEPVAGNSPTRYRCQATEMFRASSPLLWWDPRHYLQDLLSRNVRLRDFVFYVLVAAYNVVMRLHWRLRTYPYVRGTAPLPTPTEVLDLQPGELVQVRSREEIMDTLNEGGNRNRGLSFDVEMVPFCGRTFRVLRRVEQIVNEKTGKLIRMPTACIILEGVACGGCLSRNRMFCPRSIYPYWHEIWLRRAE